MRISLPSVLTGSLGTLLQRAIGALNVLAVTLWGYTYGATYKSTTNLTLNVSDQVFSAASNTNGAMLWRASGRSVNGAGSAGLAVIANATSPNSPTVGDVLAVETTLGTIGANFMSGLQLEEPVFIPAGKGLWWNVAVTEVSAYRQATYTLF